MSYAERLAATYGTEKDKVHCPFYFKIGACRHGDRCSRQHNKPAMSQTILVPNMYQNPAQQFQYQTGQPPPVIDEAQAQQHFDDFYEDVFTELSSFGEIEELHVCNNLGDHLIGNVYGKFYDEDAALAAQQALQGRFYAKRMLTCEFSPVTDFREARCRQFDNGECTRGGYCNFMHLYRISYDLEKQLFGKRKRRNSRSPSSRRRRRSRSASPRERDNYHERDRGREREEGSRYHERERGDRERERERERDRGGDRADRGDRGERTERGDRGDRDRENRRRERSRSRDRRDRDRYERRRGYSHERERERDRSSRDRESEKTS